MSLDAPLQQGDWVPRILLLASSLGFRETQRVRFFDTHIASELSTRRAQKFPQKQEFWQIRLKRGPRSSAVLMLPRDAASLDLRWDLRHRVALPRCAQAGHGPELKSL